MGHWRELEIAKQRTRYRPLIRPWDHQARGIKRLWRMGSALLWWDTGIGKTKTVCDYAFARHLAGQVDRILVVCPLAAVGVWEQEVKKQLPVSSVASRNDWKRLSEVQGAVHELKKQPGPQWVIVTYNALQSYAKFLSQQFDPHMIVFDESHYLKTYSSTRTKRAMYMARQAPYVVCLSATPAPNGYIDLYYQIKMVDPTVLPPTISEFRSQFCVMGGFMGREIKGYKNRKELARRLARVTLRQKKDILNLPPEIDQVVPVTLDARSQRVYDTMQEDMVVTMSSGRETLATSALTMQLRLGQITGGFLDGEPVGEQAKLKILSSLLESMEGQKVIVWALFRDEIDAIGNLLDRLKISHTVITGDVTGRKRTDAIKAFQTEDNPQVLVCQIAALGVGVTLTAASIAIYYSFDWKADVYEQTRGRIARPGQKHTCHYIHLLAKGTVDEDKYHVVQNKMATQEALGYFVRRMQSAGAESA